MTNLLALVLLLFSAMGVCAQQDETAAPLRVARLSYFSGSVEVQRADNTGDPDGQPVLNMPIGEGSRVSLGDYAEAELEFEDGSVVRLTPRSTLLVDGLTVEGGVARTKLTVLGGLVYLELRKSAGYVYEVTAGGVTLEPVENSVARILLEEGPAIFSVLSGTVRVERGFSAEIKAGESLHADPADESRYFLQTQVSAEAWDNWNAERDRAAVEQTASATAARDGYAGTQGYGWSDLDASGTWYDVPGEGAVWQPAAADEQFDPYGFGSWVWQGTGYTWASGYSWGWVPYRCGHWSYFSGFGWGWQGDAGCGRWGSHPGGVRLGPRRPPHYHPVLIPMIAEGSVHRTIPVRDANGPRPALLPGGIKRVHGEEWKPVQKLGLVPVRTGSSLARDYPVNARTRQPVLGVSPKNEQETVIGRAPSANWRELEGRRVVTESGTGRRQPGLPANGTGAPGPASSGAEGGRSGQGNVATRPVPVRAGPVKAPEGEILAPHHTPVIVVAPNGQLPVRVAAPPALPATVPAAPPRPAPAPPAAAPSASVPQSAAPRAGQSKPQ